MTARKPRALLSWSSGKDSAWSLHVLRSKREVDVVGLLTTVNEVHDRVAMHAVRRELLRAQAASAGLPLWEVDLPSPCSNDEYEARMASTCARAVAEGIEAVAFGDLFLEDIRAYREKQLAGTGLEPLFPLWKMPTRALAIDMIEAGVRATVTCCDPKQVPASLAGREWDTSFLGSLPPGADPCGENGEFHTFVHAGPMLRAPLAVEVGPVVHRDGFVFADIRLHDAAP